jgi:hypothetical protein
MFRYFRMTETTQNYIHEKIKSRLNTGNACCHAVHSPLPSPVLPGNIKFKIYKTVNSPVFYQCETWPLALREEQGAEGNVWTQEGWSDSRLEKNTYGELHNLCFSRNIIRMIKSTKIR